MISASPRSFLCKLHHPTCLDIHPTRFPLLSGDPAIHSSLVRIPNSKTSSYTTLSHINMIADRTSFQFARFIGYATTFTRIFLLSFISIRHTLKASVSPPERLYATRSVSGAEEISLWSQYS